MTLAMLCQTDTSHLQPMLLLLVLISLKMKVDPQVGWERLVGSVLNCLIGHEFDFLQVSHDSQVFFLS